jgi:hypothetical protein
VLCPRLVFFSNDLVGMGLVISKLTANFRTENSVAFPLGGMVSLIDIQTEDNNNMYDTFCPVGEYIPKLACEKNMNFRCWMHISDDGKTASKSYSRFTLDMYLKVLEESSSIFHYQLGDLLVISICQFHLIQAREPRTSGNITWPLD